MSLTAAQFQAWLDDERSPHVVLIEADYRDTSTNALGTEYMATRPYVTKPTDSPANRAYRSIVQTIPEFKQTMSDAIVGRTTANVGKITCNGGTATTDAWLFGRDWVGRGLRLYVGDPSWPKSDFRAMWTGVIADFQLADTRTIVFVARDMQHLLNQPIRTPPIDSGAFAGRPAPVVLGQAFNVPAILLDSTAHKYQVNDGPVAAITAVRIAGVAAAYTASLFDGTFTHSTANPAGAVTADVTAATVGTNPLNNASDLIRYLVTMRGYLQDSDLDATSFATLKALCPAPLADFIPPSEVQVYDAVDDVLNTVGAFTSMTRDGKFYVRRFDFSGSSVLTINQTDIEKDGLSIVRVLQPVRQIRIGSKTNYATSVGLLGGFGGVTEDAIAQRQIKHRDVGTATNTNQALYAKMRGHPNPRSPGTIPNPINPAPPVTVETPDPGTLPSLFINQADASAEAARRMTIWGVPRYIFRATCFVSALRLNLGDTVTLVHPRYQLASGRTGVIIGVSEKLSNKRAQLDIIV